MRRLAVAAVVAANVAAVAVVASSIGDTGGSPVVGGSPDPAAPAWAHLGPQARCDGAVALVARTAPWPTVCRWRRPGETLEGQAFPPPRGDPPYDTPRIEIYLDPAQSREAVARAIAHELGHMHHTREPAFVPAWLAARGLAPDTPDAVWTEDYAEVFAALFGPPSAEWRAPTARPGADALADLRARFFS